MLANYRCSGCSVECPLTLRDDDIECDINHTGAVQVNERLYARVSFNSANIADGIDVRKSRRGY